MSDLVLIDAKRATFKPLWINGPQADSFNLLTENGFSIGSQYDPKSPWHCTVLTNISFTGLLTIGKATTVSLIYDLPVETALAKLQLQIEDEAPAEDGHPNGVDPPQDDAAKEEMKKLEGTWTLVKIERDGQIVQGAIDIDLMITGNQATQKATRKGDAFASSSTLTVDPTKKPKTIDLTGAKGEPALGIYELDGNTFKTCWGAQGKGRQASFTAENGQFIQYWVPVK